MPLCAASAAYAQDAPADARFPADGAVMGAALFTAYGHWGTAPCLGRVDVAWDVLEPHVNATASWSSNEGDGWSHPQSNFDCRITFNRTLDFDWSRLCTVMAHEVGHLLGHRHADDPAHLMSAAYGDALAACVAPPAAIAGQLQPPAAAPPPAAAASDAASTAAPEPRTTSSRRAKRRCTRWAQSRRGRARTAVRRSARSRRSACAKRRRSRARTRIAH
jgi:pyruvate/2-oxoglutarate dehydrogenase complex dihydrolipoamide acyltransferase (E2) component